jgi:predicted CopG family antitoxin
MFKNKISIIVEDSTRNELRKIKRKEQTYDQVIKELIEIKPTLRYE